MRPQVRHGKQSLTLTDPRPLIRVGYAWNRLHYHPRVVRLNFETVGGLDGRNIASLLDTLLGELGRATAATKPLLYRTTLPEDSLLINPLRKCGFLETRRVYEPVLHLGDVESRKYGSPVSEIGIKSMAELISEDRKAELLDLYIDLYARTSRLDPATPERLSREEWADLVLADSDLLADHSRCALAEGRLAGLCAVYRTETVGAYELGVFGVATPYLERHQELCLTMLLGSVDQLKQADGETLTAEIDSDDPWTLYACADLPFRHGNSSVSLACMPTWRLGSRQL